MTVLHINRPRLRSELRGSPAQYITMTGSLVNGAGAQSASITVLCGPSPPTQTDGWAQWNIIARPRQVGMTISAGYNPIAMDVQLRFEAVTNDYLDRINGTTNISAQNIEAEIRTLLWMTGRGPLYAQSGVVGNAAPGDPPVITVFSVDRQNAQSPLIPPDFQNMHWVISSLAWDASPLRNARGYRTRQDVTVSLLQYVQDQFQVPTGNSAARAKQAAGQQGQHKRVTTTQSMNTIQQVANQVANDATAAAAILQANKDVKGIGTSPRKVLPAGTPVKVPVTSIKPPAPAKQRSALGTATRPGAVSR